MAYHLTYKITPHPEGIAKEQVPAGDGACDALIVHSLIYPPDGSLSLLTTGTDGRHARDVSPNEMFKVWSLMSKELADNEQLSKNKRELCQIVFETICAAITGDDPRRKG